MSIRTTVAAGAWSNLATGPATVQLISPDSNGAEVMLVAQALEPATNVDGLVLSSEHSVQHFSAAQPIWAQVVQTGLTALVATQPEAT